MVFRPHRHAAPAGEHLWIGEGSGERGAELHELPDGPASFHHGDLRSSAAALWHPSYHFCAIHHHRSHHVFPICAQSQEKTPPQHIRERARPTHPGLRCWSALIPLCTCEMNVCPPLSFSNHIAIVHSQFSHSFQQNTACFRVFLLPAGPCPRVANRNPGEVEWGTRSPRWLSIQIQWCMQVKTLNTLTQLLWEHQSTRFANPEG